MIITYYTLETVDSTNSWAKRRAEHFAQDEFAIITADEQTQGRGRFKRSWLSPKGKNLYITCAFFSQMPHISPFIYSQIASLTALHIISAHGIQAKMKWPNDILVDNKKIAGVLTEVQLVHDKLLVIVGTGININANEEEMASIGRPATSMSIEKGTLFSIQNMKADFQAMFLEKLKELQTLGHEGTYQNWHEEILWMKDNHIVIQQDQKTYSGTIARIDQDGSLVLQFQDGSLHSIYSGEIIESSLN